MTCLSCADDLYGVYTAALPPSPTTAFPVAKEIELKDPVENMGAQLLKEVATKTNDGAGDGTTTATLLAQVIVTEGLRNVAMARTRSPSVAASRRPPTPSSTEIKTDAHSGLQGKSKLPMSVLSSPLVTRGYRHQDCRGHGKLSAKTASSPSEESQTFGIDIETVEGSSSTRATSPRTWLDMERMEAVLKTCSSCSPIRRFPPSRICCRCSRKFQVWSPAAHHR